MITSQLNTYQIADFLEWSEKKQLILNPDFQRRSVWTQPARVFLIDTILRELSLPKFYIRTKIDLATKHSVREVVDGQQRLRAIIDFAADKFALTKRAGEYEGYKYSTLPEDMQEKFLKYTLAVEMLVNASDSDVLEVFARLNSYGERLNPAEIRHAQYQGSLKWAVHNMSRKYGELWEKYKIIGIQQRLRMADDSTMAELFGIILDGVTDGGEPYLNKLYSRFDENLPGQERVEEKVASVLDALTRHYDDMLYGPLGRRPQFIMLFAAVAHSMLGIPVGGIQNMPARKPLKDSGDASAALGRLSDALTAEESADLAPDLNKFKTAAGSSTQRIKSRQVRFVALYTALTE